MSVSPAKRRATVPNSGTAQAWAIPTALCSCGTRHRTWATVARCLRPWAVDVSGSGLWCYVHKLSIPRTKTREHLVLYPTQREALAAKQACLASPCCGSCNRAQQAGKASFYTDLREHLAATR